MSNKKKDREIWDNRVLTGREKLRWYLKKIQVISQVIGRLEQQIQEKREILKD